MDDPSETTLNSRLALLAISEDSRTGRLEYQNTPCQLSLQIVRSNLEKLDPLAG